MGVHGTDVVDPLVGGTHREVTIRQADASAGTMPGKLVLVQRMRGSRIAVCLALAGSVLGSCSDAKGEGSTSGGCGGDAPVVAFDHETVDPERGIGGGVPEVSVVSADGDVEMVTGSWVASQAAFAPDGRHLVVVRAEGDYESAGPDSTALWVMGSDGSEPRELTDGGFLDEGPDWSPDGSSVLFVRIAYEGGGFTRSIATVPTEGGDPVELFSVRDDALDEPVWSPDGQSIAFVRSVYSTSTGEVATRVWTMAADGSAPRPLVELPYVGSLDWHPDGTMLLAGSGSQDRESYLIDADSGRAENLGPGVVLPTWAPDGESVYSFADPEVTGDGSWRIVEADLDTGALVGDRTVLDADDLDDTVLVNVSLYPGFALAVAPCG